MSWSLILDGSLAACDTTVYIELLVQHRASDMYLLSEDTFEVPHTARAQIHNYII
jgi:hypothetical protein